MKEEQNFDDGDDDHDDSEIETAAAAADEEEEDDVFEDACMQRGLRLRQLRELERQDEQARRNDAANAAKGESLNDHQQGAAMSVGIDSRMTTQDKEVLSYASYLQTQQYYDDLKHVDYKFIDYGSCFRDSSCIENGKIETVNNKDETEHDDRDSRSRLIMEQDKSLGKGGICWDAAYILADFLISVLMETDEWKTTTGGTTITPAPTSTTTPSDDDDDDDDSSRTIRMLELGCGTGLCGILVAAAAAAAAEKRKSIHFRCVGDHDKETGNTYTDARPLLSVSLTDLPELMPLIHRNINRNFHHHHHDNTDPGITTADEHEQEQTDATGVVATVAAGTAMSHDNASTCTNNTTFTRQSTGCSISAFVLDWGTCAAAAAAPANDDLVEQKEDKDINTRTPQFSSYDVIFGADVVATLYDPTCLAWTIHAMANAESIVYISFKERLSSIHRQFESLMQQLFAHCEVIHPLRRLPAAATALTASSYSARMMLRNRNPDVRIFVARNMIESPQF
jgi:Lysine methyltransferase